MDKAAQLLILIYLRRLIHTSETPAEALAGTRADLKNLVTRFAAAESIGDATAASVFMERATHLNRQLDEI